MKLISASNIFLSLFVILIWCVNGSVDEKNFRSKGNEAISNKKGITYMSDQQVTTDCEVMNEGYSNITFQKFHDWQGHVGPAGYPQEIPNGESRSFQHAGKIDGSIGAVVYRIEDLVGQFCDCLLSWSNLPNLTNKAFAMVREAGYFDDDAVWPGIFDKLFKSGNKSNGTMMRCSTSVEIGDGNYPLFKATVGIL
ncbi:hypothetical protein CRYUN_Cryun05aG0066300 [Craigia yunnanensis]